jgi:GDP/UDP-N,N'-diacetylbacillosamine 2-epimerase (hydrolysing)
MTTGVRHICYLSGTRADFGLMQSTLKAIDAAAATKLSVIATGMHLSERFGLTVTEIDACGLNVIGRIPVNFGDDSGAAMARNLATILSGCVQILADAKPDVLLLLGDRGEMLAGALAAIHLNIPIAHVHGGERSGTVDEPVRHAISKLAHFHFAATAEARERLIRMGEREQHIWVTGAPGLDGLRELACVDKAQLCQAAGLDPARPIALFVYHPVLQEASNAGPEARQLLAACIAAGFQVLALMPNSDAGNAGVREALQALQGHAQVRVLTHLARQQFVSWMKACDVMIGNSSSGIIEAATFGTPVINVGVRQNLRERNRNVRDIASAAAIVPALAAAIENGRFAEVNAYEQSGTARQIAALLADVELSPSVLLKTNVY